MSGETRSDDDDLSIGRISSLVERSVGQRPSITAVRQAGGERTSNDGSGLVVPLGVPSFDHVARAPLNGGDVLVWVGSGNEERTVGEKKGRRMVHSLVG